MDIPERLLQYRHHFAIAITASAVLSLLLYAAPRLITILAYFWPLLASTAVFLMLILVFGGTFTHMATDSHGEKAGEGLLDYVCRAARKTMSSPKNTSKS
ncbi:hypothetical protein NC653_015388 [Populus alba x Populus x berolinensis]|uniref:Uncharacterized protein n=1 Tax=Populus alba x Populus x berolinensis TaxID=444605 RepID=A0AAD6QKD9_9ROSI|nr:hypothetical protein NC653_015388 [Populus alba x Populus x berolinensis]